MDHSIHSQRDALINLQKFLSYFNMAFFYRTNEKRKQIRSNFKQFKSVRRISFRSKQSQRFKKKKKAESDERKPKRLSVPHR